MLDSRGIEQKIYDLAAVFQVHMKAKRYAQAKYCYDNARGLAVDVELEQEKRTSCLEYVEIEERF